MPYNAKRAVHILPSPKTRSLPLPPSSVLETALAGGARPAPTFEPVDWGTVCEYDALSSDQDDDEEEAERVDAITVDGKSNQKAMLLSAKSNPKILPLFSRIPLEFNLTKRNTTPPPRTLSAGGHAPHAPPITVTMHTGTRVLDKDMLTGVDTSYSATDQGDNFQVNPWRLANAV